MEKYYKYLTVSGDRLLSSYMFSTPLGAEYKKDIWTEPNPELLALGYGLSVFTKYGVEKYLRNYGVSDIRALWECEIGEVLPLKTYRLSSIPTYDNTFQNLVSKLKFIDSMSSMDARTDTTVVNYDWWPVGTVLTDKVKLIKEVRMGCVNFAYRVIDEL